MPTDAVKVVVAKLAKLVMARAVLVAALRETKPPLTALKMPPMVVEAPTNNEPEVEALPNQLFPVALRLPLMVVEPKMKKLPLLSRLRRVVVAVPRVVEEMVKTVVKPVIVVDARSRARKA